MIVRVFTLFFMVFLVSCATTGEPSSDEPPTHIGDNAAGKIYADKCSKGAVYRNNIAYAIQFKIEGKLVPHDDPNWGIEKSLNRIGENLKKRGYEVSVTGKLLQIPHEGKMVSYSQWDGDPLEAQRRFLKVAKETLNMGGIDYLSIGSINISQKPDDHQIGLKIAAATTSISLLNVTTGEEIGVTSKTFQGEGSDAKGAMELAMTRSLEASVKTVVKHTSPPPKSCLSKGHQILLWFKGYSNERRQVTPFRNELEKKGVKFIRSRKRKDENYEGIYNEVFTVRYKQKGFGLDNLINKIIDKLGLNNVIDDVQPDDKEVKIIYKKPKD